ncbi:MAG: alpha/beta fold hydrolase [Actinomycetota bacterium]
MGDGRQRAVPPIEFAPARGARIAYQDFGDGPPVVAVPPTAQNIEAAWERPEPVVMFERLASFCRYVHFDKRGTGSSDRRSVMPGLDERVDDMRAVLDHAQLERAHLFAASEGGPMAILFAATYPERVDSLTLFGAWARFPQLALTDRSRDELRAGTAEFAARWGTKDSPMADGFAPSLAADETFRTWHQSYERKAATADAIGELLNLMIDFDVREVLPTLDLPTLVIHRRDDRVVPLPLGEELAANIPGAQLVVCDGADHFGYAGDQSWLDDLERFVTGTVAMRPVVPRPAAVRIRTMGRFAVEVDGEEIPASAWRSRQARLLCKRLAIAGGWPVTRDELIELLWPGDPDVDRLGARLSVQLSAVRRVLRGGVIADRQTVRLDRDEVTTDLDGLRAAKTDEEIVAAFGGELLPEDRYDDWVMPARDEVNGRFAAAARRVVASTLEINSERAAALARQLVELDEYDLVAHQLLAEAFTVGGDTSGAHRARQRRDAVAAELGVDGDAAGD